NYNGSGSNAVLQSSGGNNSWEGPISLTGNATIAEAGNNIFYVGNGYQGSGNAWNSNISLNGYTLTLDTGSVVSTAPPPYELTPTGSAPGKKNYPYSPTNIFLNSPEIYGTGGLNVTGSGVVTLFANQSNSFSGTTQVTSGRLIVDVSQAGVTAIPS